MKLFLCLPSTLVRVSPLIFVSTLLAKANPALSQASNIVPDNTLGEESSQVIENVNEQPIEVIIGGAQREQNLFHSFQKFNVSEGRGAYFNSPNADIQNIFSRVTGNNVSNILGTLGVDGAANLYLINPNGIVFGENAALDVQGSFVATTANGGIEFGEQGTYSAINPQLPQLLTVNPSAYLFNQIENQAIGDITNQADLRVAPGEDIVFFSGNINLINSSLVAPGGEIVLGSVENITLVDTFINVSSDGGGLINFIAQNLEILENSIVGAGIAEGAGSPDAVTGNIVINVAEKFRIDNSYIANLLFDDAKGTVGNIEIFAGSVFATRGALIDTSSSGQGNAGIISITATDSVVFDGKDIDGVSTGIFSQINSAAMGNAGDIFITSRSLKFTNGAKLEATTDGRGNAGDINRGKTEIRAK